MFDLTGKVALVTGGASGIGLAISQTFAKQGAHVHILELNIDLANQVVADIKSSGGSAEAHVIDISKQTDVVKVIDGIAEKQTINILVNNAGIAHVGRADNTAETDFDRVLNVNVKGVYNCLFATIPHLKKAGGGVILNMASIAATVGIPDRFAYSTAKGAVYSMTLSVAKDYLADGIRCNSVSPARVHTPFVDGFIAKNYPGQEAEMFEKLSKTQPIGRMAKPDEIGALALYLCSDEASFITGCDYLIDGGFEKLNN
ncbi:NAD(P)-dependent dehydrogenase, short-chain alcohol dehydrogenase family [Dyadobacter koreensis]|uniref:NAD(P)-dependent dehydrogenase, short-chain alcohol dehydrogenase family n=1 Tax=Dyadobacter koreensis TaxID=408657 RepID=A0A1H7AZR0_9BACT|nr:SDR family oxidoreductase [Dyadobacter koreensis]SEJ67632.1 NAD(P)-dependent dehydrogenase, short-chain alcohol dehydrogenase family [Dyadobacter koreensis]